MRTLFVILFVMISTINITAQQQIFIDEDLNDWSDKTVLYSDPVGDVSSSLIDLKDLWCWDDENYLFIRFHMDKEINLQNDNVLQLFIDTDNNASSGLSIKGIGADLEYSFGSRSGKVRFGSGTNYIDFSDIGFISGPTVTSDYFEFVIEKDAIINGNPLFTGNIVKILFRENSSGGDYLPDGNGGVEYTLQNNTNNYYTDYSISKESSDYLRILSYNVERDGLFSRTDKFSRTIPAIAPDIIGFEEIYNNSSQQAANLVETFLPSGSGENWYHAKEGPDIICVSRYPVINQFQLDGNGAFLLNLRPKYNSDLLFIVAHTPCCDNNDTRQAEVDNIMAFVRDAKLPGGQLTIDENTPIVIVGDMNFVGFAEQLNTFITGNIGDNATYGADFNPDWDDTDLTDSKPKVTNLPHTFTWYNLGSAFAPGRLDFIFYTDAVMQKKNDFVLFTEALPQQTLTDYGMLAGDVTEAADHCPVVADFALNSLVSVNDDKALINNFNLKQNYPNPFNPTTTIDYNISTSGDVKLIVYNSLGEKIKTLVNEFQQVGNYSVEFKGLKGKDLSSGVYFYKLQSGDFDLTKKMVLIK